MEGTIGNAEKSSDLSIMCIFAIALEKSERSDEIALLQEMVRVWQAELFLLNR